MTITVDAIGYDLIREMIKKNNNEIKKVNIEGNVIGVNLLNSIDYLTITNAIDRDTIREDSGELLSIKYKELSEDYLKDMKLHRVQSYASSSQKITGNHYRSDCDTYGSYYYNLYLFFVEDMNLYFTIEEKWVAC